MPKTTKLHPKAARLKLALLVEQLELFGDSEYANQHTQVYDRCMQNMRP
jgi:hypothetical protein